MRRILIIGSPGSGKSTLAKELARRTGLALVHLDQIYWLPDWVEPVKAEWINKLDAALAGETWIMDGNYNSTLERRLRAADTAVLLDLPRRVCMWRVLRRIVFSFGRTRPDMATDCPERIDMKFLLYVWGFRRRQWPVDLDRLRHFSGRVYILRSAQEIDEFLCGLTDVPASVSKA